MDPMVDHHPQVALQQKEEDGIHHIHLMVMELELTMVIMVWVVSILHQLVVIRMTTPEKLMVVDMVVVDQIISPVILWQMSMAVVFQMVGVTIVVRVPMDLVPTWVTQAPTVMIGVMDMVEQMDMMPMVMMEAMMVVTQHLLVVTHQRNMDHQVEPGPVMMNTMGMKAMGVCPLMVSRVITMVVQSQVTDHHRPQGVAMHPLPHTDTKSSFHKKELLFHKCAARSIMRI